MNEKKVYQADSKYHVAYRRKNYKVYSLQIDRRKHSDIIEQLDKQESPTEYIRQLIVKDMNGE